MSHEKPWLKKPEGSPAINPQTGTPWPTTEQVLKAQQERVPSPSLSPTPPIPPYPSPTPSQAPEMEPGSIAKLDLGDLETDLIQIMGTLQANGCDNVVVIGLSNDGRVLSLRRPSRRQGANPYVLIGALEAFKQMIITHELQQQPVKVEE